MNLFQGLSVVVMVLQCSNAQIFPFSNLRAFFDPKTAQGKDNNVQSGTNVSRPYRQADPDVNLPALHEFDSPDIFTINRDIANHRNHPPSSTETGTYRPKRRNTNTRYHAKIEQSVKQFIEDDAVFITPRPNPRHRQSGDTEDTTFSKVKPKTRTRGRKPQITKSFDQTAVEPVDLGTAQIPTHKEKTAVPFLDHRQTKQPSDLNASPDEPTIVENVPSLSFAIDGNHFEQDGGLIDYLVPPKLPSVYEKNVKRQKLRSPPPTGVSKLKSPHPTTHSKKDNRFRIKKHRNDIKSTSIPLADRLTTAKRHVVRRRPTHQRPVRKPPGQNPSKQVQQQATLMDEQITAETGFTGTEAHPHHHHGGERVEFQMHGQKGPNSYKFGYDTGKGHNRQFRFEEKDNHGHVKGHYGYYGNDGKLQIVNYEADPHSGFKAESV